MRKNRKNNQRRAGRTIWILLVCLAFIGLNYNAFYGFMVSSFATLFMLLASFLAWRRDWLKTVGLRISLPEMFYSFLLFSILNAAVVLMTLAITKSKNINFVSHLSRGWTVWYLSGPFQVFNEEILLGALLLKGMRRIMPRPHQAVVSITVASVFSFFHFVAFAYLFSEKGYLSLITLFSLLCVGIIRNNAILSTGHIGYSWAIHFAWNLTVFGGVFIQGTTKEMLEEFELFNLILGNPLFSALLGCAMLASFWIFRLKKRDNTQQK